MFFVVCVCDAHGRVLDDRIITDRSQYISIYRVKDENGDSSTSQRLSTDAGHVHFAVASQRVQRIRSNSRRTITYVFSKFALVYVVDLINMSAGDEI